MSRARILADYASTGVTAAEFDFLDTTSGTPGSGTFLRGDKTWVAAGSTSATDLDSGTLAHARMASDTILQGDYDSDSGTNRTTSSTFYVDVAGLSVALTTKALNSKIIVNASSGMAYPGTGVGYINIKRVISGGATTNELVTSPLNHGWINHRSDEDWSPISGMYVDAPAQAIGTTITYTLRMKSDGAAMFWLNEESYAAMSIEEIAP